MPSDKYLFIEYWTNYNGISTSGQCNDAAMIDFPTYSYHSGSLDTFGIDIGRGKRNMAPPAVGFFGYGNSHSGAMGGGAASELHVIEELPYIMLAYGQYEIGVIHSMDAQGGVVVTIGSTTYLLQPGREWAHTSESDPDPGCHLVVTSKLKNYGLLDKSQVNTASEDHLEYLQRIGATNASHHLAWTDDGTTLIFATRKGIRFYSTSPLAPTEYWETSTPVLGIAISPNGSTLAAANVNGPIQLWDTVSGQPIGAPMSNPQGPWLSLAFSPSGETLASGSYDGIIQLWDTETQKAVGLPWTDEMYTVMNLDFSSDGRLLLSSSGGNSAVKVWDVATGQPDRWDRECGPMDLSTDNAKLACLETDVADGTPTLYVADFETRQTLVLMTDPAENIYDLTFSPDGTMLASGSDYGRVQVWDATTGEMKGRWTLANGNWFDSVTTVVFNPDGTKLAACNRTGAHDWTVWLLDLETRQTTAIGEIW